MAKAKIIFHPTYEAHEDTWRKALDVYEGTGGFLDPKRPYLIAHPREWLDHSVPVKDETTGKVIRMEVNPNPQKPSRGLQMRRKLARYENVAEAILGSVFGALFRTAPTRTFGAEDGKADAASKVLRPIQQWYGNCDGKGTSLNDTMADGWIGAAVFGHVVFLVEPPSETVETQADRGLPVVRKYTPLDVADWLTDANGKITAIKLLEAEPRTDFDTKAKPGMRVRVVDEEKWTLYDSTGTVIDEAEHGMGRLPIAFLYGRRRPLTPVIGKSVMGDPNNFIDHYNLGSEVRELQRTQTFAILNVPIGVDGNVEEEQAKIGSQSGTTSVLFSSQPIQYVSPEGTNVELYYDGIERLHRSLYRLAKAPWEGDSRVAESADSRRIKRDEQHQTLATYAAECQRTDDLLVELAYRAMHGAEQWEKAKKQDEPLTRYPEEFTPSDIDEVVARMADAMALDLGPTATKALKKATARQLLPGLSEKELQVIDGEIDAQNIQTAEEKQAALLKQSQARFMKPQDDDMDPDDPMPMDEDVKKEAA